MTSIFKQEDQIPAEYRIEEINQQIYLLNGECVKWNGPTTVIYSPVCIPGPKGLSRKIVGTVPDTTAKQSLEALDAAVAAYNNGLGEWPSMSVEGRIDCMKKFVFLMNQKRSEVIKLLMWEIGKNLAEVFQVYTVPKLKLAWKANRPQTDNWKLDNQKLKTKNAFGRVAITVPAALAGKEFR